MGYTMGLLWVVLIVVEATGLIRIHTVEVHPSTFRSWAMVEGEEGGRIVFVKKGKLMASQLWRGDEGVLVEGAHSQQVLIGIHFLFGGFSSWAINMSLPR